MKRHDYHFAVLVKVMQAIAEHFGIRVADVAAVERGLSHRLCQRMSGGRP